MLAFLVALAAACTPSSQPERASQTEPPQRDRIGDAVSKELEATWSELSNAKRTCTDACCLDGMLTARGRALARFDRTQVDEALREIVRGSHDAGVRAVAIAWLSQSNDMADLPLFERYVDATDPAWSVPYSHASMSQRATFCEERTIDGWEPRTLGGGRPRCDRASARTAAAEPGGVRRVAEPAP